MADEGKEHQADPQVHPALETKVCILRVSTIR